MSPQRYPRGLDVALDTIVVLVGVAIICASAGAGWSSGHPVDLIDLAGLAADRPDHPLPRGPAPAAAATP